MTPVRGRSLRALAVLLVVLLGVGAVGASAPAGAAEGPAPASNTRTVIADVHTDAVATSWDDGRLVLASVADTPDLGTAYEADDVWFHVDEQSRVASWPGVPSFVAPTGSTVWLASQTQQAGQIWPGFSTESVPAGTLDGDDTTLTLEAVDGPGDVEVWQTQAGGSPNRLWSSDEAVTSFTVGPTHMHANWAFTQPGLYDLTVRADATVGGTPVSDTAVYTFVVGELPETVLTSTTLQTSDTELTVGEPITLTATVSPAAVEDVDGAVEFRDGTTVLGHDPIDDAGVAELTVTSLGLGARSITAHFAPTTTNLATPSASQPVTVTVTDGSGVPFSITGIEESYEPGDTLTATAAGFALEPGQQIQWLVRPVGSTHTGTLLSRFVPVTDTPEARAGALSMLVDASYDDYELRAAIVQGDHTIASTPWSGPISVADAVPPLGLSYDGPVPFRVGDTATLEASGRSLEPGETLHVARQPALGHYNLWIPGGLSAIDARTFAFEPTSQTLYPFALQVVRDGLVVAQSEPLEVELAPYEVLFEGMQPAYRAGQTFSATMTTAPDAGDRVTYSWAMYDDYENPMEVASGEEGRTFEMPVTADMDGKRMFIQANIAYESGTTALIGGFYPYLTVTEDEGQLFLFSSLSDHYHQGSPIDLRLTADPGLSDGDHVTWEWRWPGGDWEMLPGAQGLAHEIVAEQALEGLQVRATLTFADAETEPMGAGPVTIHVDDHGIPAVQVPTVGGPTAYTEGEGLALRRELPANGPTVLTEHRWERRADGSDEWEVIEGQAGLELAAPATLADDGASYRVSILKPNGEVAYGPSEPVTITVAEEHATELAIAGVEPSYEVGDVLRARVVGRDLEEDQTWRWVIRPVGSSASGYVFSGDGSATEVAQGRLRQLLDAGHDGYEIRARLRQGTQYVAGVDTPWVPIEVADAVEPISGALPPGPHHIGDELSFPANRPAGAGESVRLVLRAGSPWFHYGDPTIEGDTFSWQVGFATHAGWELAWQTMRDGVVVATSEPFTADLRSREVLVQGVRPVYRVGQSLQVTAEVHPMAEGLTFRWSTYDEEWNLIVLGEGTDASALTLDLPIDSLDWDGRLLSFSAIVGAGTEDEVVAGSWSDTLVVSDASPDEQLLFLSNLAGHYHQGNTIDLALVADPALAEGDTITWEWMWPGTEEWIPFPGASGTAHELIAEQALDGVQVRATVDFAAEGVESMTAEPVTIHVDDHGSPARQQPTVGGAMVVTERDMVTLTRQLPENGPTVLTGHRWERKVAGSDDWVVIEGATGPELSFRSTLAHHGAQYRVSIVKPDGEVAYGPSPAVILAVADAPALSAHESWVWAADADFLGRGPTPTELAEAVARLDGGTSRATIARELATSDEWLTTIVTRLYADTLGRQPDADGLAYWTAKLRSGAMTVAKVAASFYGSPEYFSGIGGGTAETWVTDLYGTLLEREPEADGLAYWIGQIGVRGRGWVALQMFQSLESRRARVTALYEDLLGRAAETAGRDYWAGRLTTEGDIALARHLAASAEYLTRARTRYP